MAAGPRELLRCEETGKKPRRLVGAEWGLRERLGPLDLGVTEGGNRPWGALTVWFNQVTQDGRHSASPGG